MTVTVLVEAPIKSGNLEKLKATLADALPETRAKEGCQSVTANFDAEGKTLVLVTHRIEEIPPEVSRVVPSQGPAEAWAR